MRWETESPKNEGGLGSGGHSRGKKKPEKKMILHNHNGTISGQSKRICQRIIGPPINRMICSRKGEIAFTFRGMRETGL